MNLPQLLAAAGRLCSWGTALAWGGGAAALLTAAWLAGDKGGIGGVLAAISNGILLCCLVGGVSILDNARAATGDPDAAWLRIHPWLLAAVPAVVTLLTLLPIRLGALIAGVEGPWSSLPESILDIAARSAVVFVAVGVTGHVLMRGTA